MQGHDTLATRFREVELTRENEAPLRSPLPTKYPLAQLSQASVKIHVRPIPETARKSNADGRFAPTPNVYLNIPISLSEVAPSTVVVLTW